MKKYHIKDYNKLFNIYDIKICKYCGITNYGDCNVNTAPYNLCEGGYNKYNCKTAIQNLIDNIDESELQDLIKANLVEERDS